MRAPPKTALASWAPSINIIISLIVVVVAVAVVVAVVVVVVAVVVISSRCVQQDETGSQDEKNKFCN